jgi:hypothetical protein
MFRIALNAVILPLEFASLHLTSANETGGPPWWMLAATLATATPTALYLAEKLFGDHEPESLSAV